jgi:hypothetical protein
MQLLRDAASSHGGLLAEMAHEARAWSITAFGDAVRRQYRAWTSATRRRAMAEAYRPIVRGFLLPGAAYYFLVT